MNIDPNGLKVLAATCTGNLGYLNISSRGYTTLMRSHTDRILASSMDGIRRHLVTVSEDGTTRVWELDSMQQVRCVNSSKERWDLDKCLSKIMEEVYFNCGD